MAKFTHLKKLDPADRTSWCELPEVAPNAAIELKYCGESNKGYTNAVLALGADRAIQIHRRGLKIAPEILAKNRMEDRELFPEHVAKNWRGIVDDSNRSVEFNEDNCAEFMQQIPDWIMDKIRNHAATPERVLDWDEIGPSDTEDLVENSDAASSSS